LAGAGFGFDGRGDVGRQALRSSQRVTNARDFQLSGRNLTCRLPALVCGPERPFMAREHAAKDRRGTLLRLRVRASQADEPFRTVLASRQRTEVRAHVPQTAALVERGPFIGGGITETVITVERVVQATDSLAVLLD